MKKSEEFIRLEEQYRALKDNGSIKGEVLEFTEAMFDVLNRSEMRINEIEDRLLKLEDFSDILSMDLYDIQSAILKRIGSDETEDQLDEFEDFDDDDDIDPFSDHHHCSHDCNCGDHDCNECDCDECEEDDDEDGASFIRCPFCNTLIFINGEEDSDELTCPFCGEAFLKSDVAF